MMHNYVIIENDYSTSQCDDGFTHMSLCVVELYNNNNIMINLILLVNDNYLVRYGVILYC